MSTKQFATGPIRRPLRGSLCCSRPDKQQQHDVRPSLLVVPVAAQSGSVTRCWFRVKAREPRAGTDDTPADRLGAEAGRSGQDASSWAGACVRSSRPGRSDEWRSARPAGAAPTIQSRSDVRTHERLLAGEPRDASKRSAARIDRPEPRREQSLVAQADSSAQLGKRARRSRGPRRARSFQGTMSVGRADTPASDGLLAATLLALGDDGYRSEVDAAVSAARAGLIAQILSSTTVRRTPEALSL